MTPIDSGIVLRSKAHLITYDFPLILIAEDEKGNDYIAVALLGTSGSDGSPVYLAAPLDRTEASEIMRNRKVDLHRYLSENPVYRARCAGKSLLEAFPLEEFDFRNWNLPRTVRY